MLNFKKGARLPDEVIRIGGDHWHSDCVIPVTTTPMLLFTVLNKISEAEEESFFSDLEVGATVFDGLPMMTLVFQKMHFDFPVVTMESHSAEENAVNLILVESDGLIVKGMRTLGLNRDIMQHLIDGVAGVDISGAEQKLQRIRAALSTMDIHFTGERQCFVGV